jgi:hypothetical protein
MAKYDYMKMARKKSWTEKELMAFKKFISQDNQAAKDALEEFQNNELIYDGEGIGLSQDQVKKGFKYLYNLGFTPTGKERSNSPFGYREEYIVKNPVSIEIIDFYRPSFFSDFRVPLYQATGGKKGDMSSMDYYVSGGQINIIG